MSHNIAIIGLGNFALKDEGLGIHALRFLRQSNLVVNADLIEAGTAGFGLFDLIKQYQKVIFLDAVNMGREPGAIGCFSADQAVALSSSFSLHEMGLAEVLKLGKELGEDFSNVKVFGVQPQAIAYGEELSETVRRRIPDLISCVAAELALPKEA